MTSIKPAKRTPVTLERGNVEPARVVRGPFRIQLGGDRRAHNFVQTPDSSFFVPHRGRPRSVQVYQSANTRLETIFQNTPTYINREATLPCRVHDKPIFMDPALKGTRAEMRIRENLRVIVTPATLAQLTPEQWSHLRVAASPYECGRVLEMDTRLLINGVPHIVTRKGGGSTRFTRETGNENPWMMGHHRDFSDEDRYHLNEYSFWKHYGTLDRKHALEELEKTRELREQGIDCERILAIFEITHLPDSKGIMRPVEYYKENGIIEKDWDPVMMVRATKSNFRLLDLVMLEELKMTESLGPLIDFILAQYAEYTGSNQPTLQEYFFWLVRKTIRQELPFILLGYEMSTYFWQDLARNISTLGEELDVGDMATDTGIFRDYDGYSRQISNMYGNLQTGLRSFANAINATHPGAIDFVAYADVVVDETVPILDAMDYHKVNALFQEHGQKRWHRRPLPTVEQIEHMAKHGTFDHAMSYFFVHGDVEQTQAHQNRLKEKIRAYLGSERCYLGY